MASSRELKAKRTQYVQNRDKAIAAKSTLAKPLKTLESIRLGVKEAYLVDEMSGDGNYVSRAEAKLRSVETSLNNMISEHSSMISKLNSEISAAEYRERKEAEEKAAAAAAATK